MNIIDVLILIFLGLGGLIGFKQGLTRSLVSCIGYVVAIVLAFILKNPISLFLMNVCPFFDFNGFLKFTPLLNIVFYEVIAFILVFSILLIILKILMMITNIFETILNFTIILGIPSKLLGMVVGIIKHFIIVFAILYIISMTNINLFNINESKYKQPILNNTPILSNFAGEVTLITQEFTNIKNKYENNINSNEFNLEVLDLFLKYNVVTTKTAENLIENGKLKINGAQIVINKYKEMER